MRRSSQEPGVGLSALSVGRTAIVASLSLVLIARNRLWKDAVWGVLVWKEFDGANTWAGVYLVFMFALFMLAIALVSQAYRMAK